MDLVNFTYHHALAPFVDSATLAMELRIHQRQMRIFWGTSVPLSRGYFPAETCFSEHMIPVLNQAGIAWTVVANNHLSRTCPDLPIVTGSGGEMCGLPNPADQAFGWDDSSGTWNLGQIAPLAARNNPSKPALVLCARRRDNQPLLSREIAAVNAGINIWKMPAGPLSCAP
jgi:hypothetical protein